MKNEITKGVAQVNSSLTIETFTCEYDKQTRNAKVHFTAKKKSGETVDVNVQYG